MATEWSKHTVVDLRAELKRRGLPIYGKKAELVSRLNGADQEAAAESDGGEEPADVEPDSENAAAAAAAPARTAPAPEVPPMAPTEPATEVPVQEAVTAEDAEAISNTLDVPIVEAEAPALIVQTEEPAAPEPNPPPVAEKSKQGEGEARQSEAQQSEAQQSETHQGEAQQGEAIVSALAKEEESAPIQPPPTISELVEDTRSRKRRSRSPPPLSEEVSRKRARPSDERDDVADSEMAGESRPVAVNGNTSDSAREEGPGPDVSYAEITESRVEKHVHVARVDERSASYHDDTEMRDASQNEEETRADQDMSRYDDDRREYKSPEAHRPADRAGYGAPEDDDRDVSPAEHPATSALYIKNFMRPLREPVLRDHLVDLATPLGADPDPSVIVDFFLDQIRTHAFVEFTSIAAASRVRIALHGKVWPDERNRRDLWVDFIPPEKVQEWRDQELSGSGDRGAGMSRWEVQYEPDHEGNITARLVEAGTDSARPAARPPPVPAAAPKIPTGPARSSVSGIERAPKGPRGAGGGVSREYTGDMLATRARPSILYKAVAKDLADRRLDNMRSYYSKDSHRDMGRQDEINRYTFEDTASFVDRGKEVFIGIRPPHRERERRRNGAAGGGAGGAGGGREFSRNGPPPPPFRPASDRYFGSGSGGVPRSRFNGEPLPTFSDYRSSDRRGGGGGGRRNNRNGRF